jgi:hypothetical protein
LLRHADQGRQLPGLLADEGERRVLVITINTGNDFRDAVKRCLDRGLTW